MSAFFLALMSLLIGASSIVQAKPVRFIDGYPVTKASEIFELSKLKVGDKGVGYTVFQGAKVEPFDVEILGLMRGMLGPGKDVILVRLSGKRIEFTGVISGMSGSPVYIDGRLLGAVSYRFGRFSKEPIAGITPIASMLEIYSESVGPTVRQGPRVQLDLTALRTRNPKSVAWPVPKPNRPKLGSKDMHPIETPIFMSGFPVHKHAAIKSELSDAGLHAIFGFGSSAHSLEKSPRVTGKLATNRLSNASGVPAAPIAPGAPISALLMTGDMQMSAVGTVTYVENGRVLGFGHPFFGAGHSTFPMATAAILNTLASDSGSYKQSAPALEVGTITHDRLTAIAGNFKQIAPMLPLRIQVRRADQKKTSLADELNVEIIRHDQWTPNLSRIAVDNAISGRLGFELGGTIDVEMQFQVGDRVLRIQDSYGGPPPNSIGAMIAADVGAVTALICNNDFEFAELKSINVEVRVRKAVQVSRLEALVPHRNWVRPGGKIRLTATLKDYRGKKERIEFNVPIPKSARKEVEIVVGGSVELDRRDADAQEDLLPTSLDELLGILADRRPGRGLFARSYFDAEGLRNATEFMSALPLSQRTLLAGEQRRTKAETSVALGEAVKVPWENIVLGQISLKLRVVN